MNIETIQFLQSEMGKKLLELGTKYQAIDERIKFLRKETDADKAAIVSQQISLREKASSKFTLASQMLFDREGLEQSTREEVSDYISKRYQAFDSVADLTCGIGGDALGFAKNVPSLIIMDIVPHKVMLCEHNLGVYQQKATAITADIKEHFPEAQSYFLDPSRRNSGQRWFHLEDCVPDIQVIHKILKNTSRLGIKVSPGLNYDNLPLDCEIEVISYNGECKEIMLWCGNLQKGSRSATLLPQNISLEATPCNPPDMSTLQSFLYEVDKAAMRAHLVDVLAEQHNLSLLDPRLSYLTGNEAIDSPWLKSYRVLQSIPFSEKKVKAFIRKENAHISLKCRGFCDNEVTWRQRLRIKNQNVDHSKKIILFLTRIHQKAVAIFTERIDNAI